MVVYRHNGVYIFFAEGTYQVIRTFLHFGVGTLHSIQLNATAVTTSVYRAYRATTQTNAVVVATYHYNLVALFGGTLQAVAFGAIAHTTRMAKSMVTTR